MLRTATTRFRRPELSTRPYLTRSDFVIGRRRARSVRVRRFFGAVRIAPIGAPEGEMAGTWRRAFADQGVALHQADCLIAAAARGIDAPLATANTKDFPMEELVVEHWPVGV